MKELFNFCWMLLGWLVAGLIFIFVVCLLLLAISLCLEIAIDFYEETFKKIRRRHDENIQR